MKSKVFKVVGLTLMMVAVLVVFCVPVAVAQSPVVMIGSYALKGNINIYTLQGQRFKVADERVRCTAGTLVIATQTTDDITGTLALDNLVVDIPVTGFVGLAGRYTYFFVYGDTVEVALDEAFTVRGRLYVKDDVIYAVKSVVIQGVDLTDKVFYAGKMRGLYTAPE